MIPGITAATILNTLEEGARQFATFDNVVFLSSWDGDDETAEATDDSLSQHFITFHGDAVVDSDGPKFGTTSVRFDGDLDYCRVGNDADFQFGNGPFCIETFVWVYAAESANTGTFLGLWSNNGSGTERAWRIFKDGDGKIKFQFSTDGSASNTVLEDPNTMPFEGWAFVCVERDDQSVMRMWIAAEGDPEAVMVDRAISGVTFHPSTHPLAFGANSDISVVPNDMEVWIDETRITKGAFWYGTDDNIPVPTEPFPRDEDTGPVTWVETYNAGTFTNDWDTPGGTMGGSNYRLKLSHAEDLSVSGETVRVTFEAGSANNLAVDNAFIGHSTSGLNFSSPVRLTFNGGDNGFSISAGQQIVSDPADFTLSETTNLIVSIYVPSGTYKSRWRIHFPSNVITYYKTGSDEADDISGLTGYSTGSGSKAIVAKIEVVDLS